MEGWMRQGRRILALMLLLCAGSALAAGLNISNRISPMDRYRDRRPRTEFIILHTTEGGDRSSLNRVKRRGLAHYLVRRDGKVYRIIQRHKVALHAGRSMWAGKTNLDRRSIGIEVVGYHDKPITAKQITALRELLRQLQGIYDIPDEKVLTHSMVAYGRPNRWHRHDHRGRKRCGMQFAQPELRSQLGLTARPLRDPDVAAGRLIEADPYLARVLYSPDQRARERAREEFQENGQNIITASRSAWYIARDDYDSPSTVYVFPGGTRRRLHTGKLLHAQAVGQGMNMRADPADPFQQVQVLGPIAAFHRLFNAAVGIAQANAGTDDRLGLQAKFEVARLFQSRVLRPDRYAESLGRAALMHAGSPFAAGIGPAATRRAETGGWDRECPLR